MKHLRLERMPIVVSFSYDPLPEAEAGSIGRSTCRRPSRYFSPFLERVPSPALESRSGCGKVDKIVK